MTLNLPTSPNRGEVWLLNLNPIRGHEQAGTRPCLVVSVDMFNHGPARLALILPLTTKEKRVPFHIKIEPPEGGLEKTSYIICEGIRSASKERFIKRFGNLTEKTLHLVEDRLRILMGL